MLFQVLVWLELDRVARAEERQAAALEVLALEALAQRPAPPSLPEAPVHVWPSEPFASMQAPAARPWREAHVIEGTWKDVTPRRPPQLIARREDRPRLSRR